MCQPQSWLIFDVGQTFPINLGTACQKTVFLSYPMLLGIRISACGFVCLAAMIAREADPVSLPAIFAVPGKTEAVSPPPEPRHSVVSDRVHRLITNAILTSDAYSLRPNLSLSVVGVKESLASDAVLMDKVVVSSAPFLEFDLPKPISPLDRFRKHGILYESIGKKFTFDTMIYVDRWYSNRQGSGGIETRAELKFNFRW